jgi:hypothetical protein
LEWLFGGLTEIKADFFDSVGIFVSLSPDTPVGGLLFLGTSSQFIVHVHHDFNDYINVRV